MSKPDEPLIKRSLPDRRITKNIKIIKEGEEGIIKGVLTSFENKDAYDDVIKEGALDEFMEEVKEIPMLWSHSVAEPIGRWYDWEIKDLEFRATGELFEEIRRASEAISLMKRQAVEGISIGFTAKEYAIVRTDDDGWWNWSYEFRKIWLQEASIVLFPANEKATIEELKSYLKMLDFELKDSSGGINARNIERLLVRSGLTRSEAQSIINPYLQDMRDSVKRENTDMSDSVERKSDPEIDSLIKHMRERKCLEKTLIQLRSR